MPSRQSLAIGLASKTCGFTHSLWEPQVKVIGVGYPRTGTKTLGECFLRFGFVNASWDQNRYNLFLDNRIEELLGYAMAFDSFEDLPWCSLFRELDKRFPGSKFILTVRKNEDAWYESERKHDCRIWDREFWPRSGPVYEKQIAGYRGHNAAVREYFRNRSADLLEVCWELGDGWAELATFLGRAVPRGIPFPHANKTPQENTFLIYGVLLTDLLSVSGKQWDHEDVESALQELTESLPAMTRAQISEILTLLNQLPGRSDFAIARCLERTRATASQILSAPE